MYPVLGSKMNFDFDFDLTDDHYQNLIRASSGSVIYFAQAKTRETQYRNVLSIVDMTLCML